MSPVTQIFFAISIFSSLGTHQWMKHYDSVDIKISLSVLAILPSVSAWWLVVNNYTIALSIAWAYPMFYVVLLASVIGYRLSPYHPLAKYPGPTIMKITKLWAAWIAYEGKTHIHMKALHEKYGSVVRIGPNELSTSEKEFIPQILGNQGMPKGPMWDGRRFSQTDAQKDYDNVVDLRDSVLHAELRKSWNQAFSSEPLKDYELLLIPRIAQLLEIFKGACLGDQEGIGRVNIAKWIGCFAFDFIGDVAFGGCFELMKEDDKDGYFHGMEAALYLIGITQHVPWTAKIMRNLPLVNNGMARFIKFAMNKAYTRYNMEMKRKDLFYHMTEASGDPESELPIIISNALLAIFAGSDTTSITLSCVVYLLLSNPASYQRLRREVDETFEKYGIPAMFVASSEDSCSLQTRYIEVLNAMPYLNAVLNEGMRLFPAVPTALQRAPAKGSGGKLLTSESLSIFLPEGNSILVPPCVIHRDPRYFSPSPDSFIPERWLPSLTPSGGDDSTATRFITSRDAFIPFSVGPQNCAGRPLALIEMRYLLAALMRNFDMEFDREKYVETQWEDKLEDRFACQAKGTLPVTLRWRGAAASNGSAVDV